MTQSVNKVDPAQLVLELSRDRDRWRERIAAEKARRSGSRSLAAFVQQAWQWCDPAPLRWSWYVDAISEHLEACARREIKRLAINIPPRHGKSNLVSILWPAWVWTWRPQEQFICVSYADTLAVEHSMKCRAVVESPWYRDNYSANAGWQLRSDQNTKDHFVTTAMGYRYAIGVGGAGTGFGADIIVLDDPLNVQDAYSKAARDEAIRFVSQVAPTRFNDAETGVMVLVMQRAHHEDPTGYVLRGDGWEHLMLPAEYDSRRAAKTFHWVTRQNGHVERVKELFWQDPRKVDGELLSPERFPKHVLDGLKAPNSLGPDGYAGQYGQSPMPPGGGMFRLECWRFWKPDGAAPDDVASRPQGCHQGPARPLPELDRVVVSVDASFKETERGSYVAIHAWGKRGADRFLLDRVHARMDFADTVVALRIFCAKWPEARQKYIEEKANGAAIISALQHEIYGFEPVNPEGGKEARAAATQPYQASGNVYLPDGAPWVAFYVTEFAMFPKAPAEYGNDDVDAQSQAIRALEEPETTADLWARMGNNG